MPLDLTPWVYDQLIDSKMRRHLTKCMHAARLRDKKRGRLPDLSRATLEKLFVRSNGRCEITGIPFSLDDSGMSRRPFAPSIDRIDNALPYSLDNCRLVCLAANIAINEWGEDVFSRIAAGFLAARADTKPVTRETSRTVTV